VSETKRDYEVSRGKPPVHSRFKKGPSGNSREPRPKSLPCRVQDLPCLGEAIPFNNILCSADARIKSVPPSV
jgi:hypothetical protein